MSILSANQLHIGYGGDAIVENFNLSIPNGEITALVGANGSGKSTILKAMARIHAPSSGQVLLDGRSIFRHSTKEVAKRLAILPQSPAAPEGLTVRELVAFGRFPHQSGLGTLQAHDRKMIDHALEITGMTEFGDRPVDRLSGGQRQRAWIAMAIAQDTEILFLDEPTTYLDMAHQLEVLQVLRHLNREEGRTIVMVVHDLNHAAQFAGHVVAIRKGRLICQGTPEEVITPRMLREVFGVEADIVIDPRSGLPLIFPFALAGTAAASVEKAAEVRLHPAMVGATAAGSR